MPSSSPAKVLPVGLASEETHKKSVQLHRDSTVSHTTGGATARSSFNAKSVARKAPALEKNETQRTSAKNEPGALENELITAVSDGDRHLVNSLLARNGKAELLFSDWAGGITQTCILSAAKRGDVEMLKILYRWGGKRTLLVKDIKGKTVKYYADRPRSEGGFSIEKVWGEPTVECWEGEAKKIRDDRRIAEVSAKHGLDDILFPNSRRANAV